MHFKITKTLCCRRNSRIKYACIFLNSTSSIKLKYIIIAFFDAEQHIYSETSIIAKMSS